MAPLLWVHVDKVSYEESKKGLISGCGFKNQLVHENMRPFSVARTKYWGCRDRKLKTMVMCPKGFLI